MIDTPTFPLRRRPNWRKVALFILGLILFIIALELMKAGARGLAPLIIDYLDINHPLNGLGFGWLMAYGVMSGSPVAAAALTFFDAGVIDRLTAFFMITGSRLGASLIVLILGLIYILRGHARDDSLVTGLISLMVTATTYIPALPIGWWIVQSGLVNRLGAITAARPLSFIDMLVDPLIGLARSLLPEWAIFLFGLALIAYTFNLIDKALPRLELNKRALERSPGLEYRPVMMFLLGLAVTSLTMSVSISVGLLVPLSARGYIRRENLVPYIMGCNITTFVDTLIAGLLLRNVQAAAIVLAEMISVTIISVLILLLIYAPYERMLLRLVEWLNARRRRLVGFFAVIFLIPLALLLAR